MNAGAPTSLRFLCFGVGAIGTYIGGSLALAGQRVVFLERAEVAGAVRRSGLRLRLAEEEFSVGDPQVVNSLEEALAFAPFDAAILAVKSFDTPAVIEMLRPYRQSLPPVLCLQNGVENEPRLAEALGAERVIAGTVTSAVGRRAAGDIVLERLRGVGVAGPHPLAPALVQAGTAAGLRAMYFNDAAGMKWSKMLTNLMANATSAILDMTPAEVFAHPGLFQLEMRQLRETLAVMAAQGIGVVDLPGTPVRMLAWAVRRLPAALARPALGRAVGRGRGAKMPSFHIDLHAGRGQSEVDYLNGAVVRAGRACGVATPVNRLLNDTLLALTRGEQDIQIFARRPERLLAALQTYERGS